LIAIFYRDRIRDKDKDPSFSAKQTRAEEERVWAEIHERPFYGSLASFRRLERIAASHPKQKGH
jgi:hypothetical protein